MAVNKIVHGGRTLIDLTSDTITEEHLISGHTAHKSDGTAITGKAFEGRPEKFIFCDDICGSRGQTVTDSQESAIQAETVYQKV